MTPRLFNDQIKKVYFSISEVSKIIGENQSTIRFWCLKFGLPFDRKNRIRKFCRDDVAKFHIIKTLLRVDKYTIEGAKQKLK